MTPHAVHFEHAARLSAPIVVVALLRLTLATAHAETRIVDVAPEAVQVSPWSESIQALATDAKGFVYAGTLRGLFRFDGVAYTRLDDQGLPHRVSALAVDATDALWIGTLNGGVFKYTGGALQPAWQLSGEVSHLMVGPQQLVWIVAGNKLWQATQAGVAAAASGLDGLLVRSVSMDHERMLVATNHGLRSCTTKLPQRCELVGPAIDTETTFAASADNVFIYSKEGCALAAQETARPASEEVCEGILPPLTGSVPYAKGSLLGDSGGLAYVDGEHIVRYRLPGVPVGSSVSAMALTANGDIWVAVDGLGLVALRPFPELKMVGLPLEQRPMPAFSVLFDHQGQLWQNTGFALLRWDGSTWTTHKPAESLNAYAMRGLSQASNGDLWVASLDGGALRLHNNAFSRVSLAEGQPLPSTNAVFHDAQAGMWLSSSQGMLYTLGDPAALQWMPHTACKGAVAAMVRSDDHGFWIASDHGLCHRQGQSERAFTTQQGLPSEKLLSLLLQSDGALWIGTKDAGLVLMRGNRFTTFTDATGLHLTDVTTIVDDDHEGLWLGTSTGLVRVNKADLFSVADGQRTTVRYLRLGRRDGMRSENFMGWFPPASAKGTDGALYFPSHAGVLAVPSPQSLQSPPPPRVFLNDVLINGSHRSIVDSHIHISQGNTLEVRYTAPRLRHPHRVRLQHLLQGVDQQWQEDRSPEIKYFGLPSGSFVLRLASSTTDRDDRTELRLRITVHPPFFRTAWFLILCAAIVVGAGVTTYRLRLWSMQRRYAAISNERTRIARDMHDTLEQNLVALKLRLEATERFAQDKHAVKQHAAAALGLVDQAMRDARSSIWSLRAGVSENVDLATQLSVCAGRSLKGTEIRFTLQIHGTPYRLQTEAEQQLVRIVQEALTNVIKHADAKLVCLSLEFRADGAHVTLHDDGTGLQADLAPGAAQGHFGIQGMRERVQSLGGELDISGKPGEGTQLTFLIPSNWRRG